MLILLALVETKSNKMDFFSSNEFLPFILSVYALCFNPKSLSFFSLTVA